MSSHILEDRRAQGKVVFCVAAAGFVFQFETFMVNVSLPTIAGELSASTTEISFVVLAYLIAATATFIPAGKLGDPVGLKKVFIASTLIAMAGTLLCGFSPDLRMLVASRAIQGIGAGGMAALGYAMIPAWLPEKRAGWGYGYLNMATGLGMLAGAPFGGLVSQYASWRWVFISNAPVIAFLTVSAFRRLPDDSPKQRAGESFDIAGTAMFSAILVAAIFSLSLGSELGWSSLPILAAAFTAAALAVAMAIRRSILHRSFLSPGIFANPGFAASLAVLFLVRMTLGGTIFLLPFYLAAICGASAVGASLILLAYPVAYAPVGLRAGRLADRIGSRRLVLSATLLGAAACASFSSLLGGADVAIAIAFLLALGVSTGIFFSPNYKYSMQCVPEKGKGEAAALIPLALNSGTVFGVTTFETVFSRGFPEGASYLKHAERISDSTSTASLSRGFSDAFLAGFCVLLAAAAIALVTYKTPHGENRD